MTTDLSAIPTMELFAEICRREQAMVSQLAEIAAWRGERSHRKPASENCNKVGAAVVAEVAAKFGCSVDEVMSVSRMPKTAKARQVAMVGLHRAGFTLSEVGRYFGRKHSTVLHAIRTIKAAPPAI